MPFSLRYPKLTQHGGVTRVAPPRNRRMPAGYLVAFYDETGRWLGQLHADTVDKAKLQAGERGIHFDSFVIQKC